MAKISNDEVYIIDTDVSDLDSFVGTDGNTTAKRTKTFLIGQLKNYLKSGFSPLTGGVLRFTEISYTGGLYANVEGLVNALDPFFTVDQYHLVVVSLNGAKSILKLQNREIGLTKTPVVAGDFIALPTSVGATGPQGIAGTNGTQGIQGIQGIQGVAGTNGTNGTNGAAGTNGTNASNNLQRDASASFIVADTDNNYVIQLKNTTAITVTFPATGLRSMFNVGFSRLGAGEVSFVGASGVTLQNPVGYRINRQFDPCYVERDVANQIYTLYGQTKI